MNNVERSEAHSPGCCGRRTPPTPESIHNRPGLPAIRYRVGTYSSFREAMLEGIGRRDALEGWTRFKDSDQGVALVNMWAYIADILTFYQERIANEAFLRTARQRGSVILLASMLDYRLCPGIAARTHLSLDVEAGKRVHAPEGTRVQSVPQKGEQPQKFETIEVLDALPELNEIRVRVTRPLGPGDTTAIVEGTRTGLRVGDHVLFTSRALLMDVRSNCWEVRRLTAIEPDRDRDLTLLSWQEGLSPVWSIDEECPVHRIHALRQTAWLFGHNAPDWNLIGPTLKAAGTAGAISPQQMADAQAPGTSVSVVKLDDLAEALLGLAPDAKVDQVKEMLGGLHIDIDPEPVLTAYRRALALCDEDHPFETEVLREVLGLFGNPVVVLADHQSLAQRGLLKFLAPAQTPVSYPPGGTGGGHSSQLPANWNDKVLPEDPGHPDLIYLDNVYRSILPGSWVVLRGTDATRTGGCQGVTVQVYRVLRVDDVVHNAYTMTSKATRLVVEAGSLLYGLSAVTLTPEHIECFNLRDTTVLVQSEDLGRPMAPDYMPVTGRTLDLEGSFEMITNPRRLVVTGEQEGSPDNLRSEVVTVEETSVGLDGHTTIILQEPLINMYNRWKARVLGNVVPASHGEAVEDEVLGSGDSTLDFPRFTLKAFPVTYRPDPSSPRGSKSTLDLRVDGVLWGEVHDLYGEDRDARVYTTLIDDEGVTTVQFGDGTSGARLIRGQDNVTATYSKGLGREGNVAPDTITTLLDRPPGLKKATNPLAAAGGTDPESLDEARTNAPNTVRTFGRIVSIKDFEDVAREYPGISKARARWSMEKDEQVVDLWVLGEGGDDVEGTVLSDLRSYLDARRDVHRNLRVEQCRKVHVQVKARVVVDPTHREVDVLMAAEERLREHMDYHNVEIGESLDVSDVYEALQAVPGVIYVDVDRLKYGTDPEREAHEMPVGEVLPRLRILPGEIASTEPPGHCLVTTEVER